MTYTAYCLPDPNGKVGLCIMLDGFDTAEAAEWFLEQLMSPYEGWGSAQEEGATIH